MEKANQRVFTHLIFLHPADGKLPHTPTHSLPHALTNYPFTPPSHRLLIQSFLCDLLFYSVNTLGGRLSGQLSEKAEIQGLQHLFCTPATESLMRREQHPAAPEPLPTYEDKHRKRSNVGSVPSKTIEPAICAQNIMPMFAMTFFHFFLFTDLTV